MARRAASGDGAFPGRLILLEDGLLWLGDELIRSLRGQRKQGATPISALLLWRLTWRSNCLETTLAAQYKPSSHAYGTHAAQISPKKPGAGCPHFFRSNGVRGAGIRCPPPSDSLR